MQRDRDEFEQATPCMRALIVFKWIVRIFGILTGIGLIILGIVTLHILGQVGNGIPSDFVLLDGLMGIYCIIFGAMVLLGETRNRLTKKLMKYLLFLSTFVGRGIFYVYIGLLSLALPLTINGVSWGKVLGGCLIAAGALNLILFPFFCFKKRKEQNKNNTGKSKVPQDIESAPPKNNSLPPTKSDWPPNNSPQPVEPDWPPSNSDNPFGNSSVL